jgi:hypothetical protein
MIIVPGTDRKTAASTEPPALGVHEWNPLVLLPPAQLFLLFLATDAIAVEN